MKSRSLYERILKVSTFLIVKNRFAKQFIDLIGLVVTTFIILTFIIFHEYNLNYKLFCKLAEDLYGN